MKRILLSIIVAGAGIGHGVAQTDTVAPAWSLKRCIDHALSNNLSIRRSANEVERQKLESNTAKWLRLPDLNASVSQSWSWGRAASPVDNSYRDIRSATSNMSLGSQLPLFTGFEIPNQQALARLNAQAAREDLEKNKEDLAMNVASTYLNVLFRLEMMRIARAQVDITRMQEERIARLVENGRGSEQELADARSRTAQEESSAVAAEGNYRLALLDLAQLLELEHPENFAIEEPQSMPAFSLLSAPEDIFSEAVAVKPGVKAAETRLKSSDHSLRIARSGYFPRLSLSAGLGTSYYNVGGQTTEPFRRQIDNNLNRYVGLNLSIPIFDRFSTRNRVRAARIRQLDLALQLEESRKSLRKEIEQAWYNAEAARAKYHSCDKGVEAGEAAFALMREKYDAGRATAVEFNESRVSLARLLSERAQAKYEYLFRVKILDFYRGRPLAE